MSSEHEKRLREEIHETRQNAADGELWLHVRLSKMQDALDALLSEHRAEVTELHERLARDGRIGRDAYVSGKAAGLEEAADALSGVRRMS